MRFCFPWPGIEPVGGEEPLPESVPAWLRQEPLNRARTLLVSLDVSVSEVAAMSGFENLSHFHRSFRAAEQETPLQYRKTHARRVV